MKLGGCSIRTIVVLLGKWLYFVCLLGNLSLNLRRSDLAWKKIFKDAGLTLIKEEVQHGLPEGLYPVKA